MFLPCVTFKHHIIVVWHQIEFRSSPDLDGYLWDRETDEDLWGLSSPFLPASKIPLCIKRTLSFVSCLAAVKCALCISFGAGNALGKHSIAGLRFSESLLAFRHWH